MLYRVKCIVQYDGSRYHGFQRQTNHHTIQQEIEKALSKMHKNNIEIHAAGRTDRGVHALSQVFHFDSNLDIKPYNWKSAINSLFPRDIYIKNVEIVDNSFHSRYNVKSKEYRYYLSLNEYNPIRSRYVCFINKQLDVEKMIEAIKLFEGTHDFTSFSSSSLDKNSIRTIHKALLIQDDNELMFSFNGSGFLRYQVRLMVGALIQIGENRREIDSIKELYFKKDRSKGRFNAEPQGLYLYNIEY